MDGRMSFVSMVERNVLSVREAEVLAAIERRLTNAEIAAELYVSVRTVESHVAALRRKLGVDSRPKLIAAARVRRRSTIQLPTNSFVGRDIEIASARETMTQHRWVTVVGTAGVGKTRLVLELAATNDCVPIVVEMERAQDGDVIAILSRAIGVRVDGDADLLGACGLALAAQNCLLVIDNCDRVTQEVGATVVELLALAPSLSVLATSRSPCGSADEAVFPVEPLIEGTSSIGAVRLFIDRARTAVPSARFSVTDHVLIKRICRRLDGLPLAIELAAARVRHLHLAEIADRLDAGLGLLSRTGRSDRHSTLEAAFEWTWDLLEVGERDLLSQLAGLPGSFDLQLAAAVAGADVTDVVLRLLDRSLLSQTATVSEPRRFRLLQSVADFVIYRTDPSIVRRARCAHAAHYLAHVAQLAARVRVDDSRDTVDAGKRLVADVAAAIDWAATDWPEVAVELARWLAVVLEIVGPDAASLSSIANAMAQPTVRRVAPVVWLYDIGIALCYGHMPLVAELTEQALGIAKEDREMLAAHSLAGLLEAYRNPGAAFAHLAIAEGLAIVCDEPWTLAHVLQMRAVAMKAVGDCEAALATFEASMQAFARAGDAMHVNNARYMMALAAAEAGIRTDEAVAWTQESIEYATSTGNLHELAHALLAQASLGGADVAVLREAIDTFRSVGDLRCLVRSTLLLATLQPPGERLAVIQSALEVAARARDSAGQAKALDQLISAHCDAGSYRDAALSFGSLVALVGEEHATVRCPAELVMRLDEFWTAIAEGRARSTRRTRR